MAGLKGGTQLYTVDFADDSAEMRLDDRFKVGWKIGGTVIFPLAEDFFFGMEGYYSRKGRKYKFDGTATNNAAYNFIELSSYLRKSYKVSLGEGKLPGFFFFNVGPNIMYWINGRGTLEDAVSLDYEIQFSEPVNSDYSVNYMSDVNRWLFGLDFGAGFSFLTKKNQDVAIELRYTHGQTYLGGENASVISILGFDDDLRGRYRVLHLSVAYLLDLDPQKLRKGKSTIKRSKRRR
ncbi:MAG: outer membrane beta-barrel protein [Candidatus Cyclobacteriaceae bacterium M2_1C_046]